ncbi:MAG TPA: hypothetical protein VKB84_02320 [Candidatus Binataceae bacterium]|jgi:hypothetical protein|nr:hypothetical protein [Candidatus Binataceae bacterium]
MSYSRRIRMMLATLAAFTGLVMLFNFLVNPFRAWRHKLVGGIYYRVHVGRERVITPYALRTLRPTTVLLGSSRVLMGINIEQGLKDGYLNAGLSAASLPEISKEVDLALKNPHLRRIIWGVDFFAFEERWKPDPTTYARLKGSLGLRITDTLLSANTLDGTLHLLGRAYDGRRKLSPNALQPIPWTTEFICTRFAADNLQGLASLDPERATVHVRWAIPMYWNYRFGSDAMPIFRSIVDKIRRADVELIVFLPPMSQYELESLRQNGQWQHFQEFKRELAHTISYVDFSGYNELARTDRMFRDLMHMQPEVGHTILRRLLGDPAVDCSGSGQIISDSELQVNSENVDQMLALQDQREQTAIAEPNKYYRAVVRALIQGHDDWTQMGWLHTHDEASN